MITEAEHYEQLEEYTNTHHSITGRLRAGDREPDVYCQCCGRGDTECVPCANKQCPSYVHSHRGFVPSDCAVNGCEGCNEPMCPACVRMVNDLPFCPACAVVALAEEAEAYQEALAV